MAADDLHVHHACNHWRRRRELKPTVVSGTFGKGASLLGQIDVAPNVATSRDGSKRGLSVSNCQYPEAHKVQGFISRKNAARPIIGRSTRFVPLLVLTVALTFAQLMAGR